MDISRRQFLTFVSVTTAGLALAPVWPARTGVAQTADPLGGLDAVEQARLIKKGDATPTELLEATISRIEALNPQLNAVVTKAYDEAREAATLNAFRGAFAGVPYLIKDLNDAAGIRTTNGCRAMLQYVPEESGPYVLACKAAGFNVLGKTNTPEFGLQATTESLALGPCYNPWNPALSSGGSSGGTAAAVASRMIPMAHGNDGGGSIRIPSSCCGVFGLKPSRGRMQGSSDEFDLAVQGALSLTVRDSAHLLASTERPTPAPGLKPVGLVKGPDRRRLKIGLYLEGASGKLPAQDVQDAILSTAELCRDLGHEVVDAKLSYDGDAMVENFLVLWSSLAGDVAATLKEQLGHDVTLQDLEPLTLEFARRAAAAGRQRVGEAVRYLIGFSEGIARQSREYDVLLSPVLSHTPPQIGEQGPTIPYDILIERMTSYVDYTPLHNITGMPAMSVPLSWNADDLPIGSHFAANVGDEKTLLHLAYELEEARPWADKCPPVSAC